MKKILGQIIGILGALAFLAVWLNHTGHLGATIEALGLDQHSPVQVEVPNPFPDVAVPEVGAWRAGVTVAEPQGIPYDGDAMFGKRWSFDRDGNGCDTRNDILARDLVEIARSGNCVVESGLLVDPYSGEQIAFKRGATTSSAVQIDHIVPQSKAAQHGAAAWTFEQRQSFANDPINLMAVKGSLNSGKGDKGPGTVTGQWLPPNEAYHCEYVANYLRVITTYALTVSPADAEGIDQVLARC